MRAPPRPLRVDDRDSGAVTARPLVAAALLLLAGCAAEPPPNLLLISIDTLRADHLSAYGYPRPTSPNIDRLAREGVLFERVWSPANWTLPAHVSMLSGLYPHEHAVEQVEGVVDERIELLPEALAALGYRSAGLVSTVPFLARGHGFGQGWTVFDDRTAYPPERERFGPHTSSPAYVGSPVVHRRAVELLDELGEGPFLLFVHYFDVHAYYRPPPPYDRIFESEPQRPHLPLTDADEARRQEAELRVDLYDGEIRWVDAWIGRLLDELDARGLADRTVVLLTADHGEEFLEHSEWEHHKNAFDTSLRVPLVVRLPGGERAGTRSRVAASLVDVPATLLAAAGRREPSYASGRDLLALLGTETAAGEREILFRSGSRRTDTFLAGVVAGGFKAVFRTVPGGAATDRPLGLYAIDRDPHELVDLRAREPRRLDDLRRRTDLALRAAGAAGARRELEAGEIESLHALGYL